MMAVGRAGSAPTAASAWATPGRRSGPLAEGVLRSFELLSPFLVLIWLLDLLYPLWDKKRQTLHDKVGGSVVLRGRASTDGVDCKVPGGTTPV